MLFFFKKEQYLYHQLTVWHLLDSQAVDMEPAIALLAVEHLPGLLATAAFDAALALGTLPVVVAHP